MVIFYPSLSITMQNKLFWWLKRVTLGCEMAHLRHQNNLFYFLMCLLFDPIRRSTVHLMIFPDFGGFNISKGLTHLKPL